MTGYHMAPLGFSVFLWSMAWFSFRMLCVSVWKGTGWGTSHLLQTPEDQLGERGFLLTAIT